MMSHTEAIRVPLSKKIVRKVNLGETTQLAAPAAKGRTLHTGADLHTDKQRERITKLFTADEHVESSSKRPGNLADHRRLPRTREPDRAKGSRSTDAGADALPSGITVGVGLGRL